MATPALATDDIITAVQIGGKSSKPLFFPIRGKCEGTAVHDVRGMVQVGGKTSKPLNFVGLARCDGTALPSDTPLIGVQVGGKEGKPLFLAGCVECDDGGPGDGEILDCFDCIRPEVINISIVRAYPENDCPFDDTQDATMTYETRTVSTYTMDPDDYPCPDPEDCTEIDCFDSENSEHPCCLPCAEYCEVTRTGYWSDVITYTFGYCYYGEPDCDPLRKAVMTCRYLLACDKDDTWRLEIVWLTSEQCCREPEDILLPQTDSVVCPGTEFPAPWYGYALTAPCTTGIFHILSEPSIPCNEDGNDINFNLTHYFFGEVALDTEITIYE